SGPVPPLRVRVTLALLPRATVESLPNESWLLITGCTPNGAPAVADPGWVAKNRRLAAAGLTAIGSETDPVRLLLLKLIVILVATGCDKLVKVTTPLIAVRLVVPCNVPLPAKRAAETTVALSPERKLPN